MSFGFEGTGFGGNMTSFNSPGQSGGGFHNETFGESPTSQGKREEPGGILPITVAGIMNAEYDMGADALVVDGVSIHQVTFVGMIVTVAARATSISFSMQDHTGGHIRVTRWLDQQEYPEEYSEATLREDTYARVYGIVKTPDNLPRYIVAFKMMTVDHFAEIMFHMYEVMRMHLVVKKRQMGDKQGGTGMSMEDIQKHGLPSDFRERPEIDAKAYLAIAEWGTAGQGAPIQEVIRKLRVSEDRCRDILVGLQSAGLVYTTIDENHFKIIEG